MWTAPAPASERFHYGGERESDGVFFQKDNKGGFVCGCMGWDGPDLDKGITTQETVLETHWAY